ncbi:MAG: DUF2306 domain-containing protein [Gammaproteobacteria bacterium]|nr:DUF2306 domain-containing protein [Gammaproteobacteria bacterium]
MLRLNKILLYFLALGVAFYAVFAYSFFPLGSLVHPLMKLNFQAHAGGVYLHVFAAALALLLGPLQFSSAWRQQNPRWHRWSGRVYLILGVLVGGLSGLYIAQFAFGGWIARSGFSLLALAWLFSGLMAYRAIRRADIFNHRRWMLRNFSLTFAAVTLRIDLGLFSAAGVTFEVFYPWLAWLCWLPNGMWAEWFISTKSNAPFKADAVAPRSM